MGPIVCATRGGEGSRAAQLQAIAAARDEERALTFLYVVDVSLAAAHEEQLKGAVRAEFSWLGRVLLQIALQRAENAGVRADAVIREGAVAAEIEAFVRQTGAARLFLGASRGTSPAFGDDAIERFALAVEAATGVSVSVVRPEDHQALLDEIRF